MARDLGDEMTVGVYSDASAAIAISQRLGLGKLRHIETQYLWLQEKVAKQNLAMHKVHGTNNPADMLTKAVNAETLKRHLEFSGLGVATGRAGGALQV